MSKTTARTLPAWAWVSVLATPAVLLAALLWFIVTEAMRTLAVVQILSKATEAGLLQQPDVQDMAIAAVSGGTAYWVLCAAVMAVVLLSFGIMFTARRVELKPTE